MDMSVIENWLDQPTPSKRINKSAWLDLPEIDGQIYVRASRRSSGTFLEIASIEFQVKGTGYFTSFLKEVEAIAQNRGLSGVIVESVVNDRLLAFLYRQGYQPYGDIEPPIAIKYF